MCLICRFLSNYSGVNNCPAATSRDIITAVTAVVSVCTSDDIRDGDALSAHFSGAADAALIPPLRTAYVVALLSSVQPPVALSASACACISRVVVDALNGVGACDADLTAFVTHNARALLQCAPAFRAAIESRIIEVIRRRSADAVKESRAVYERDERIVVMAIGLVDGAASAEYVAELWSSVLAALETAPSRHWRLELISAALRCPAMSAAEKFVSLIDRFIVDFERATAFRIGTDESDVQWSDTAPPPLPSDMDALYVLGRFSSAFALAASGTSADTRSRFDRLMVAVAVSGLTSADSRVIASARRLIRHYGEAHWPLIDLILTSLDGRQAHLANELVHNAHLLDKLNGKTLLRSFVPALLSKAFTHEITSVRRSVFGAVHARLTLISANAQSADEKERNVRCFLPLNAVLAAVMRFANDAALFDDETFHCDFADFLVKYAGALRDDNFVSRFICAIDSITTSHVALQYQLQLIADELSAPAGLSDAGFAALVAINQTRICQATEQRRDQLTQLTIRVLIKHAPSALRINDIARFIRLLPASAIKRPSNAFTLIQTLLQADRQELLADEWKRALTADDDDDDTSDSSSWRNALSLYRFVLPASALSFVVPLSLLLDGVPQRTYLRGSSVARAVVVTLAAYEYLDAEVHYIIDGAIDARCSELSAVVVGAIDAAMSQRRVAPIFVEHIIPLTQIICQRAVNAEMIRAVAECALRVQDAAAASDDTAPMQLLRMCVTAIAAQTQESNGAATARTIDYLSTAELSPRTDAEWRLVWTETFHRERWCALRIMIQRLSSEAPSIERERLCLAVIQCGLTAIQILSEHFQSDVFLVLNQTFSIVLDETSSVSALILTAIDEVHRAAVTALREMDCGRVHPHFIQLLLNEKCFALTQLHETEQSTLRRTLRATMSRCANDARFAADFAAIISARWLNFPHITRRYVADVISICCFHANTRSESSRRPSQHHRDERDHITHSAHSLADGMLPPPWRSSIDCSVRINGLLFIERAVDEINVTTTTTTTTTTMERRRSDLAAIVCDVIDVLLGSASVQSTVCEVNGVGGAFLIKSYCWQTLCVASRAFVGLSSAAICDRGESAVWPLFVNTISATIRSAVEVFLCSFYSRQPHRIAHSLLTKFDTLINRPPLIASIVVIASYCALTLRDDEIALSVLRSLLPPLTANFAHSRLIAQFFFKEIFLSVQNGGRSDSAGEFAVYERVCRALDSSADVCRLRLKQAAYFQQNNATRLCCVSGLLMSGHLAIPPSIVEQTKDEVRNVLTHVRAQFDQVAEAKEAAPTKSAKEAATSECDVVGHQTPQLSSRMKEFTQDDIDDGARTDESALRRPFPVSVYAGYIESVANVAALCRAAEVFGVERLIVASPLTLRDEAFRKISVLSERHINVAVVPTDDRSVSEMIRRAKADGVTVIGIEQCTTSRPLQHYAFPRRCLLVFGREKTGLPYAAINLCDTILEVPQFGLTRSLNVHVTAAVVLWSYVQQNITADL